MLLGTVNEIWRYPVKSMAGELLSTCTLDALGIPGDRGWALKNEVTGEITNGKHIPLLMQCAAAYREEPFNGNVPHVEITLPDGGRISSDDAQIHAYLTKACGKTVTLWPRQPASNRNHYRRRSLNARILGRLVQYQPFRSLLPTLTKLPSVHAELGELFSREPGEPVPDLSTLPPEILEFTSPLGTYFDAFPIHLLTTASLAAMESFKADSKWDQRRFRPNFLIQTAEGLDGLVEAEWSGRVLRIGSSEIKCEIPTVRCGMTIQAQKDFPKDPGILRTIVKKADQNLGSYANVVKAGTVSVGDPVELI